MIDLKRALIGQWGLPSLGLALRPVPYGRRKGVMVSDLSNALRHLLARFGRPETLGSGIEHDEVVDDRLTALERRQLEIAARLQILEQEANPWGIGRDT